MNTYQEQHSKEIENTRVGGFGGSDAAIFYKVGLNGLSALTATDKKRIRVAKGIEPYEPIPATPAMQRGHDFEDWFASSDNEEGLHASAADMGFQREKKIQRQLAKNFDTFAHADFYQEGAAYELKCVKQPEQAILTYHSQLQWYYAIGVERVLLITQDSSKAFGDGMQIVEIGRDEEAIAILLAGVQMIDEAWNDVADCGVVTEDQLLPFDKAAVVMLNDTLRQMKALEEQANECKKRLQAYMQANNISTIKSEYYTISYVGETERKTFDKKLLAKAHPEIDLSEYEKNSKVAPSVKIILK